MQHNQPIDLDTIQTRIDAASRGPWTLAYEYCDCSEDCGHGLYVSRIDTGAGPATELCDLPRGEWELMVHAREDVEALVAKVRRLREERDKFADRVDTLTAVAKGNKRHVQDLFLEFQKAQSEITQWRATFGADALPDALARLKRAEDERDEAHAALTAIRHLHKDSPMGPCPVCIDADAAAAGGDGLVPYPCPTARLAGAQDCDPPSYRAPAEVAHVVADDSSDPEHVDDCPGLIRPCGHDDYHDPHDWADRPSVWCPGISYADDEEPTARPAAGGAR